MKQYRKKGTQCMVPYSVGMDVTGVSISMPDKENGSPKVGDMIAVNREDPDDKWLIAEKFFSENYEEI